MRRAPVSQASAEEAQEIDLTPMLDVVFIMLIFFIVTASFVKEPGVDINSPSADNDDRKKYAQILIGVTDQNKIWVNREEIEVTAVKNYVQKLRAENPNGTVVIRADDKASVETLVKVMDAAREIVGADVAIKTAED